MGELHLNFPFIIVSFSFDEFCSGMICVDGTQIVIPSWEEIHQSPASR